MADIEVGDKVFFLLLCAIAIEREVINNGECFLVFAIDDARCRNVRSAIDLDEFVNISLFYVR